jgi:hypothetical protein
MFRIDNGGLSKDIWQLLQRSEKKSWPRTDRSSPFADIAQHPVRHPDGDDRFDGSDDEQAENVEQIFKPKQEENGAHQHRHTQREKRKTQDGIGTEKA